MHRGDSSWQGTFYLFSRSPCTDKPLGVATWHPLCGFPGVSSAVLGRESGDRSSSICVRIPRRITPGCRLQSLRSFRPTLGLSRRLPKAANGAPALRVRQPETLCEMPKNRLRPGFGGMAIASRRIRIRCAPCSPYPLPGAIAAQMVVGLGGSVGGNGITEGGFSESLVPGPRVR